MKKEILDCACYSIEHAYIITFDKDFDNENMVYINPHLTDGGFWHRLKYAFKYLFGWKSRYGCFDEIIINKTNYQPLKHIINYIEQDPKLLN